MSNELVTGLDVDYRDTVAVSAGVWFRGWSASETEAEVVTTIHEVAPYQPANSTAVNYLACSPCCPAARRPM